MSYDKAFDVNKLPPGTVKATRKQLGFIARLNRELGKEHLQYPAMSKKTAGEYIQRLLDEKKRIKDATNPA
jgi:hypothetical protein